jgi:hypothetical protein
VGPVAQSSELDTIAGELCAIASVARTAKLIGTRRTRTGSTLARAAETNVAEGIASSSSSASASSASSGSDEPARRVQRQPRRSCVWQSVVGCKQKMARSYAAVEAKKMDNSIPCCAPRRA